MLLRLIFTLLTLILPTSAFNVGNQPLRTTTTPSHQSMANNNNRRSFIIDGASSIASIWLLTNRPAYAVPMITTEEFRTIVRDSAQAISRVEFSGPKSDAVVVKLVDGTSFGISDVIESSTDPRSPLKISALCRENLIPTKFTTIEAALAGAPKKKKLYTNERVQIAAEKEKARKERMEADEDDRLAKLYTYELEEAKVSKAKP